MRQFNGCRFKRQQGQVFVIVALSLVALIGSVGLAVDSGLGYMVKAKLNTAVDAASIAAARAVAQGADRATQTDNAQKAAQKFFAANYPATGYLGSTPVFPNPTVTFDPDKPGRVFISASASATVPVTFMRVLNFNLLNVAASAETVRQDLDMAFVVDTTGSMTSPSGTPAKVQSGAISFLRKFSETEDRVALIQFAYGSVVKNQINTGKTRGFKRAPMESNINGFNFVGSTNSAEGMWNARDQLNHIAATDRSSLRVIVFFSDGAPNSFSSFFSFKTASDCTLPGTISTGDGNAANWPIGLRDPFQINAQLGGKCWQDNNIKTPGKRTQDNSIVQTDNSTYVTKLPDWYNAHNKADQEFPIVSSLLPKYAYRAVTSDTSSLTAAWRNVNLASRNLLEAMAMKSREEGIYVFTLGLGGALTDTSQGGPNREKNEDILKCMANTADALPRCQTAGTGQPVGLYCHAVTADDLKPCFEKLASAILRISK